MPRDHDDDRPKKSWREIDQAREKGTHRPDGSNRSQERLERSQSYSSYKTQLNKLFDGGAVPDALKAKLAEAPVGSAAKERKEAGAAILDARTAAAANSAVRAYITAHGFPEDEEVLTKILDLTDESWVLQAIQNLTRLQSAGALRRGASLKARLKTAQLTCDDQEIRAAAGVLLAKL